ncbi:hypothetical protein DFH11DRAFT_1590298, partial [Phellopilus nigrolimitatus]
LCLPLALMRAAATALAMPSASRVTERMPWLCAVTRRQARVHLDSTFSSYRLNKKARWRELMEASVIPVSTNTRDSYRN